MSVIFGCYNSQFRKTDILQYWKFFPCNLNRILRIFYLNVPLSALVEISGAPPITEISGAEDSESLEDPEAERRRVKLDCAVGTVYAFSSSGC